MNREASARMAVALVLAMLAVVPATAQRAPDRTIGTWFGTVLEVSGRAEPHAHGMTMTLDGAGGRIDYVNPDCAATLTRLATVGDVVEYRETIVRGADFCVDGGTVGVRLKGDLLLWYRTGENTADPHVAASPVLARVRRK